jgi:hypothetical protein
VNREAIFVFRRHGRRVRRPPSFFPISVRTSGKKVACRGGRKELNDHLKLFAGVLTKSNIAIRRFIDANS